jgi:hypothetical protein
MRFSEMSNEEVLASLKSLVLEGNRIVAKVIAYLVEAEERRMHLELACSSMFEFCVRKLGFSDGAAFRRIAAARLVQRFPTVLDAIASGRVNLSNVVLLRDYFTEDNVDTLLDEAAGKTKRQIEEWIARLAPKADVPSSIRKLPVHVATAAQTPPGQPLFDSGPDMPTTAPTPAPLAQPLFDSRRTAAPVAPTRQVQPLSESRYRVQLTASVALRDKLEHARRLLSHRNPSGDLAEIIEQALDVLIEKLEKAKLGKAERPRPCAPARGGLSGSEPTTAPKNPANITRAVRRQVVGRDGFRCSFVAQNGERCSSRERLEFDHHTPRALGGTGDAANIRLLCRAHNRLAAERVFCRTHIDRQIHFRQGKCGTGASDGAPRERVRSALRSMGFRNGEAEHAIATLDSRGWNDRPIEVLVRDALGVIM